MLKLGKPTPKKCHFSNGGNSFSPPIVKVKHIVPDKFHDHSNDLLILLKSQQLLISKDTVPKQCICSCQVDKYGTCFFPALHKMPCKFCVN